MSEYTFAAILRKTDELDEIANSKTSVEMPVYKSSRAKDNKQVKRSQREDMKRKT